VWREWWNLRERILIFSSVASASDPLLFLLLYISVSLSLCVLCLSPSRHDLSPLLSRCHSTGTVSFSAARRMCNDKEEEAPAPLSTAVSSFTQPLGLHAMHWPEAESEKK
jgi:hypothetical protein